MDDEESEVRSAVRWSVLVAIVGTALLSYFTYRLYLNGWVVCAWFLGTYTVMFFGTYIYMPIEMRKDHPRKRECSLERKSL